MFLPLALALIASASEAPPPEEPPTESPDLFGAETQPPAPEEPPAEPVVPEVTIVSSAPAPKKRRAHRKAKGTAPDVGPPPPSDGGVSPMFDGAPPGQTDVLDAESPPRDEPAPPPKKGAKRRKPIDPKKTAAKMSKALDGLSVFVATRRYGNLTMSVPGSTEQIPIAALAAATPEEREEVEEALVDVIEELAITLTSTQAAAIAILAVYGKRWWGMEQTANALHGHLKGKGATT